MNFDISLKVGDLIRESGVDIGTVQSVNSATSATLESNYSGTSLSNQFAYVQETPTVEGDRFKGYYIRMNMENDSADRVELFSAEVHFSGGQAGKGSKLPTKDQKGKTASV